MSVLKVNYQVYVAASLVSGLLRCHRHHSDTHVFDFSARDFLIEIAHKYIARAADLTKIIIHVSQSILKSLHVRIPFS